jgi:hypothetical protein
MGDIEVYFGWVRLSQANRRDQDFLLGATSSSSRDENLGINSHLPALLTDIIGCS